MQHSAEFVDFVTDANCHGGTYHRIDFGDGLVLDGEYDMQPYWPRYGFPDDLRGLSVLDVGTSSGHFAIEFARRGADVTAIDVSDGTFQRTVFAGAGVNVRYLQKDLLRSTNGLASSTWCSWVRPVAHLGSVRRPEEAARRLSRSRDCQHGRDGCRAELRPISRRRAGRDERHRRERRVLDDMDAKWLGARTDDAVRRFPGRGV